MLGRRVEGSAGEFEPGAHEVPVRTDRLAPGVYVVRVAAEGPAGAVVESRRLTVAR